MRFGIDSVLLDPDGFHAARGTTLRLILDPDEFHVITRSTTLGLASQSCCGKSRVAATSGSTVSCGNRFCEIYFPNFSVSSVTKHNASSVAGLGFDSRAR